MPLRPSSLAARGGHAVRRRLLPRRAQCGSAAATSRRCQPPRQYHTLDGAARERYSWCTTAAAAAGARSSCRTPASRLVWQVTWRHFTRRAGREASDISSSGNTKRTGAGAATSDGLGLLLDLDLQNFDAVMAGTHHIATIVDCHADWCQPCRMLGPMLTKAVEGAGGRLRLAKMDVDANPLLARELRVESMPTVYAVVNEKIVEHFVGLLPQSELDRFVANVLEHHPGHDSSQDGDAKSTSGG